MFGSEPVQETASPLVLLRPKHLPGPLKNGDVALAELIVKQPRTDELVVEISKSKYKLSLVYKGEVIKEYPVVFGPDPVNDKLQEGDKRTPEGKFKVRDMYPHQSWSKFIWLDYPNAASWKNHRRAIADGAISSSAGIGGEIGIHGVPGKNDRLVENGVNWTAGCISLKTEHIDEVYSVVRKGTSIEITH